MASRTSDGAAEPGAGGIVAPSRALRVAADESCLVQNLEMLRDGRPAHGQAARELAHGSGSPSEPLEYSAPRGVGQGSNDVGNVSHYLP